MRGFRALWGTCCRVLSGLFQRTCSCRTCSCRTGSCSLTFLGQAGRPRPIFIRSRRLNLTPHTHFYELCSSGWGRGAETHLRPLCVSEWLEVTDSPAAGTARPRTLILLLLIQPPAIFPVQLFPGISCSSSLLGRASRTMNPLLPGFSVENAVVRKQTVFS